MRNKRRIGRDRLTLLLLLAAVFAAAVAGTAALIVASPYKLWFTASAIAAGTYAGFFTQVCLHELGHLLGGLMSGYRFCSFRIGSIVFVNNSGRISMKRYSLPGTGGQCLMAPPPLTDGKCPFLLYNLSGVGMNVLTGLIMAAVGLVMRGSGALYVLMPMAFVAFVLALTNGIPLRTALVDNDGRNALTLNRNPDALRAFWIQLKLSEMSHAGMQLKDMPEEWFKIPDDSGMQNSMTASLAVFAAGRMMCEHRFEDADRLMARLIIRKNGVVNLHKVMLRSDRIFCELMGENRAPRVKSLLTENQKKMMRMLGSDLSVIRTQYSLALFHDNDAAAAAEIKAKFEKIARNYPFAGELETERGLIAAADEKYTLIRSCAEVHE